MGNYLFDSKCEKLPDSLNDTEAEDDNSASHCNLNRKRLCKENFETSPRSIEKGHNCLKKSRRVDTNKENANTSGRFYNENKTGLRNILPNCKPAYLKTFFKLFDDDVIQDFLWNDGCARLSDKYLLAMVYVYFRRAKLSLREYNRLNFFAALFLAHDMEEDDDEIKHEIFPWALGTKWKSKFTSFIVRRDGLLKRMRYRSVVSKLTCTQVFGLCPEHPIWLRERQSHHGGAERLYPPDDELPIAPKGPNGSPMFCDVCRSKQTENFSGLQLPTQQTSDHSLITVSDHVYIKNTRSLHDLACREE